MDNFLVSIIVPTFNRANFILESLRSCIVQTYPNFEILVVDDGSTDNTHSLCEEILDKRLKYFYKENGGCSSARNYGISLAKGDFFVFLDSDDLFRTNKIGWQIEMLRESKSDYCVSDVFEFAFRPEWHVLSRSIASRKSSMETFSIDHFMTFRARNSSVLFSRKVFEKLRFREDLLFNEDSELLQRVAIEFKGSYLPEPTVYVRNHPGNKSTNPRERVAIIDAQIRSLKGIYSDYPDFANELGENRFRTRLQELAREKISALLEQDDIESANQIMNEWDIADFKEIRWSKLKSIKTYLIHSNSMMWRLFCKYKKEV